MNRADRNRPGLIFRGKALTSVTPPVIENPYFTNDGLSDQYFTDDALADPYYTSG